MIEWPIIFAIVGGFFAWSVTLAGLVWWLASQFKLNRHATYTSAAQLRTDFTAALEKLEERHDARIKLLEYWRIEVKAKMGGETPDFSRLWTDMRPGE